MRSFTARLGPRQSMVLQMAVMFLVVGSLMALGEATQRAGSLVTWCQNFMVAGSARIAALAVGVSAALGLTAFAAVAGLALFAAGETVSALRFARAVRRNAVPSPARVLAAVSRARIRTPVTTVEDAAPFAVTVGLLRPRIVISSTMVGHLTAAEVAAVLAHEDAHARDYHPLRALCWESLRRVFFFLPSLRDATDHFALMREIAADRHAVAERGSRALASAMLKAMSGYPPAMPAANAPFGHMHSRIAALAGNGDTEIHISPFRTAATVSAASLIACANLLLGNAAVAADAQTVGRCEAVAATEVTSYVFTPDFSILVPRMSTAPVGNNMSSEPPVQSTSVRP